MEASCSEMGRPHETAEGRGRVRLGRAYSQELWFAMQSAAGERTRISVGRLLTHRKQCKQNTEKCFDSDIRLK